MTATLTILSFVNYNHSEQRLTSLQGSLTASLLGAAPVQVEAQLDRVVGLAAESPDPVATFRTSFASLLQPKGPYTSAALVLVHARTAKELEHLGAKAFRTPSNSSVQSLFVRAASNHSLVTARSVRRRVQRLAYLVSATGPNGTYVVGASQQLAIHQRVKIPSGSPDADADFALYWGRSTSTLELIETNVARVPIKGTVSVSHISFGDHSLTLLLAPRAPLSGTWSAYLPWAVLVLGVLLSVLVAGLTERLSRRRQLAETLALENGALYRRQRELAETLQRALLPKSLPALRGLSVAARYVPAAAGAEVGGDWYSVVPIRPSKTFLIVGDVSGHGIDAAGVMGSLRFTARTLARLDHSPSAVLEHCDGEIDISDGHFATALVGVVDADRSSITLASAGHLRPLVMEGDRSWAVPVPVGPPLGLGTTRYEEMTIPFNPGSTLLAFTDGLVERRGEDIDVGTARVRDAASVASADLGQLLDHVLEDAVREGQEDDIAVLAVRRDR